MSKLVLLYAVKNYIAKTELDGRRYLEISSENDLKTIGWRYETFLEIREYIAKVMNECSVNVYLPRHPELEIRAMTNLPSAIKPDVTFYKNEYWNEDLHKTDAKYRMPVNFQSEEEIAVLFHLVENGYTVFFKVEDLEEESLICE